MFVQFESVAAGAVVLELTLDCHWIEPIEPVAKVSVLLSPLQIAPAPEIVLTVEAGLTVTVTTLDVELEQAGLETTTWYAVVAVKFPVANVEVVFPATAANVPTTPPTTVAFCQEIVPEAPLKLSVVPVPVQIKASVSTILKVPTDVG